MTFGWLALIWKLYAKLSPIIAGCLLALFIWACLQWVEANSAISGLTKEVSTAKADTAFVKEDLRQAKEKGQKELAAADKEYRDKEAEWKLAFETAERTRANDRKAFETNLAAAVNQRDGLRKQTAAVNTAYFKLASKASCNPEEFQRSVRTSITLGELLEQSDRLSEQLAIEAERLADRVREDDAKLKALQN